MPHLKIDQLLKDYNTHKQSGELPHDRNSLGKEIWKAKSSAYIRTTLSLWANPRAKLMPHETIVAKICRILNMSDEQFNQYVK